MTSRRERSIQKRLVLMGRMILLLQNSFMTSGKSLLFKEEPKWYVIRVISGTEENVRTSLMQRREMFNMQDYILDCFVPMHDILTVKK